MKYHAEEILFTKSECEYLLSLANNESFVPSKVINRRSEISVNELLSSNQIKVNFNSELKKLILNKFSKFGITDVPENITLIKYIKGDYLNKHTDNGHPLQYKYKTCIIQLSDESDYTGGDFIIYNDNVEYVCSKKQGNVILFSSSMVHEVRPLLNGTRFSIVIWFEKPHFSLNNVLI